MNASTTENPLRLAVLNPGGNDAGQAFPDFAGEPDARIHAPVNYHAFAACTAGSFHRDAATIGEGQHNVLLLLRHDLDACFAALQELKRAGKIVAVSLKESGAHQVAEQLGRAENLARFQEICALADGCLSSTQNLAALYRSVIRLKDAARVEFIPTPYPVDDPRWDFSTRLEDRAGVLIGTREFRVPSRNHLAALLASRLIIKPLGETVTVVHGDGQLGESLLAKFSMPKKLNVIEGTRPYPDYLRMVARHKIVFQLDRSAVPGQVAGDALLCRVPCVGGDGAIERLVFPDLCGHGRDTGELVEIAARLLDDAQFYAATVETALAKARKLVSFGAVAEKLDAFFRRIAVRKP